MSNSKDLDKKDKIPIKYKEAADYKVYHADGAHGGWTPRTNLSIDFYVERSTFPEVIVHSLSDKGDLGPVIEQKGEKGIRRERQFGVILSIRTAVELRNWLNDKIKEGQEAGLFSIEND